MSGRKKKKIIKNIFRYMALVFLMFIAAINYNLFLNPNNIISGGGNGISIILQELFSIDPATFILIMNSTILIFSFFVLGVEKSSSSIVAILIYPFFVSITSGISSISFLQANDSLLIGIFSGIISGFVIGTVCKIGFSQGGIIQISQMINKMFNFSIAKVNFVINSVILLCGVFVFGLSSSLLGIVVLFISSLVADKIILGISSNKSFMILTSEEELVKEFIVKKLGHGVTVFMVDDKDSKKKRKAIMTVIPTGDYYKLTDGVKKIDKDVFFVVTDSYQLEGGF